MSKDMVKRLRTFLSKLRQGEFEEREAQAFRELNLVVRKFQSVRTYLLKDYLPALYREGTGGKQHLIFIANGTLNYPATDLASLLAGTLVDIYAANLHDEETLSLLLDIVLKYELDNRIGLESGRNLRFEGLNQSFVLNVGLIRSDIRLRLLHLVLGKYARLLVDDGPPNPQDLLSTIDRANDVISLLLDPTNQDESIRYTALQPFTRDQVVYSPKQSQWLFGTELDLQEYEQRLLDDYRIPLFPIIRPDKLSFLGNKIGFTNEGQGSLPPSTIRVQVGDAEFELGTLPVPVPPNERGDLFTEEESAFSTFLRQQSPNQDIKVVFSFSKFGRSYDLGVFAGPVGHWRDQIPKPVRDIATPIEIPLDKLNERDFERLCYWIVETNPKDRVFEGVIWLNEDGGGERGRDIIAKEVSTHESWVFQCKRVKQFGPKDIENELNTFAEYVRDDPSIKPDVYVLFISRSLTDKTKSRGDELAAQIGMAIKYWPKSTIDRLVRINEEVKERFWKLIQQ